MGSAAAFMPTCLKAARLRSPPKEAPRAISTAIFSLLAHWQYTSSRYWAIFSKISVLGVPG